MRNLRLKFSLLILLTFAILGEAGYLFFYSSSTSRSTFPHVQPSPSPQPQLAPSFDKSKSGFISSANDNSSFLLLGTLNNVTLEKNGDVFAHVKYQLDNGIGKSSSSNILLFSHTSPNHLLEIDTQNSTLVYAPSNTIQSTSIDMKKNAHQAINILEKYYNQKVVLTFLTLKIQNGNLEQPLEVDPQTRFVASIKKCNSLFFSFLSEASKTQPDCIPYALQISTLNTQQ